MSELVTDYEEGTLPFRTRLFARMHLICCAPCTNHYRQMRETIRLVRSGAPRSLAESVENEVLARLARSRPGGMAGGVDEGVRGSSTGHANRDVNDP